MNNEIKKYNVEGVINPYFTTVWLLFLISVGIKMIIDVLKNNALQLLIFLLFTVGIGIVYFCHLIFLTITRAEYIEISKGCITGRNRFNKILSKIYFEDINYIYVKGKTYFIWIKDVHGKTIAISTALKNIEELINIIIKKSINCKSISIKYIESRYPNINIYEK